MYSFVNKNFTIILFKLFLLANALSVPFYMLGIYERFHASGYEYILLIPYVIALLFMLLTNAYGNKHWWLFITVISALLVISNWHSIMNYNYLILYINLCITLALICDGTNVEEQISRFCKYTIGLVFLLATFQKIISPQFISGTYFYHSWFNNLILSSFLSNIGFEAQADEYRDHWSELMLWFNSGVNEFELALPKHSRLKNLANIMVLSTIFIESSLAILFLLPNRTGLSKYKDFFLICFLLVTYFIAPMIGYGILFVAMGYSQTRSHKWLPTVYLFVGVLVTIISIWRIIQIQELYHSVNELSS